MFRKIGFSSVLVALLVSASQSVMAAPVDLTALTDAVDFTSVSAAILAVAALITVVYVVWKAATLVIGAVRRL